MTEVSMIIPPLYTTRSFLCRQLLYMAANITYHLGATDFSNKIYQTSMSGLVFATGFRLISDEPHALKVATHSRDSFGSKATSTAL
jgi:hypothetical protein